MFNALVVGTGFMHISCYLHGVQQTVAFFVLGLVYSLVWEGLRMKNETGVFGTSYEMWMDIDPHLLLFTLLPSLLAGDAMTIDTSVAKRVAYQCLWFAGPGVLVSALIATGFLMWYLEWSFYLCLTVSSILCATDPVAVVALLKELGANPVLTVQIQGESLLNDGTAIVLYMVASDFLRGKERDAVDITTFLVKTALMAVVLGVFIGYFFFFWIRLAGNKFNHSSSMLQITLTICCAYLSFILTEGVFHLSGVLATVSSSLVLAHHMWPHIVSPDSLTHVWHTIESLGNILIFFLAGALTGNSMVHVEADDYWRVFAIYMMLVFIRGLIIFSSLPILRLLSSDRSPVSLPDAAVMTWGGLRGAVGLAMAIEVATDRAPDSDGKATITEDQGQRSLFFVAGVAFLTIIINASTAPMLVRKLGITALPSERLRLLKLVHEQLVWVSTDASHPPAVIKNLEGMLTDIQNEISRRGIKPRTKKTRKSSFGACALSAVVPEPETSEETKRDSKETVGQLNGEKSASTLPSVVIERLTDAQDNEELVKKVKRAEAHWQRIPHSSLKLLGELPEPNLLGQVDGMVELLKSGDEVDFGMARVVNKAFLSLVSRKYRGLITSGYIRPGSAEADLLMTSLRVATGQNRVDLIDFAFIERQMEKNQKRESRHTVWKELSGDQEENDNDGDLTATCREHSDFNLMVRKKTTMLKQQHGRLRQIVISVPFNVGISVIIIANSIQIAVEEASHAGKHDVLWALECAYTVIYVIEFLLKFIVQGVAYFKDIRNQFDFALVILGALAVWLEWMDHKGLKDTRLLRIMRIFRMLRFLRVFTVLQAEHFFMDRDMDPQARKHVHRILTLMCFAHGHLKAQISLVHYFGVNGKIDDPEETEIARCILQSQIAVYRAIGLAMAEESRMNHDLLNQLKWLVQKKEIIEHLTSFVTGANQDGAISAVEAESILHPLHREISHCLDNIHDVANGKTLSARDLTPNGHGGSQVRISDWNVDDDTLH